MIRKLHLKADKQLGDIQRELPFSLVNPENASTIKTKFLRRAYSPEFTYAEKPDIDRIQEKLAAIKCGRTKRGKLLASEQEMLTQKAEMIQSIGTVDFAKKAKTIYGTPDKKLISRAEEFLELPAAKKDEKIRADAVRRTMKHTFKLLGFQYAITRGNLVASAQVMPGKRQVQLRSKERFGRLYTYRLAVHEIATHALRAENGRQQGLGIFLRGTPKYLATEEGLAAYNEERAGVMTTDILRNYAGRVIAIHMAEKQTFMEIYQDLRSHFTKAAAFKLALRVKRGLPDGEHLGSCPKDHVYLKGYLDIKDYVSRGEDLRSLYMGKIGLEDLKDWEKRLEKPKYIPEPVIEWVRNELLKIG